MPRHLRTEGIVLKKTQLLNKDIAITVFTADYGKLITIAKGVRKIVSKRLPSLMTGNLIRLVLYQRGDTLYLQDVIIISLFTQIKNDQLRYRQLYFLLFILEKLLPDREVEKTVFNLLKLFLIELSKSSLDNKRLKYYFDRMLVLFGYGSETATLKETIARAEEAIGGKIPVFII